MSGGSMNYLFTAGEFGDLERMWSDEDMDNLAKCVDIVKKAVNSKGDFATEVAKCIGKGLMFQKAVEEAVRSREVVLKFAVDYKDLLYACEWYDSGDWGIDKVRDALMKVGSEQRESNVARIDSKVRE